MSKPVKVTTTQQPSTGPNSRLRMGELALAIVREESQPTVNTASSNTSSSNT